MKDDKPISSSQDAVNANIGNGNDNPYIHISHLPTINDYIEMKMLTAKNQIYAKNDILFKILGLICWTAAVIIAIFLAKDNMLTLFLGADFLAIAGFVLIFYHDVMIPWFAKIRAKNDFKKYRGVSQVRTIALYNDRLEMQTGESIMKYPVDKATNIIDGDNCYIISFGLNTDCQIPKRLIASQQCDIIYNLFNEKCKGKFKRVRITEDLSKSKKEH